MVIEMKKNEKWVEELYDALMKWLELSTKAAESQMKYNKEWSLSSEVEVEMEDEGCEEWSEKFQEKWG